jgi:lysophospholipase L1-like esterase
MVMTLTGPSALGAGPYTIVAFGDSTTAPRGPLKTYAQILQKELPERGIDVNVVNAGVGGNSTADARKRFEKDVLAPKPNLVIIQFGICDSAVDVYKNPPATRPRVGIKEYKENLQYMVRALKERNIKTILMTPNPLRWTPELKRMYGKRPYHPESDDGFNVLLKDYAEVVRRIAGTEKIVLVDVYAAFESYGREPSKSVKDLLLDGMHPNNNGQRLVANLLLPRIGDLVQRDWNGRK